MLPNDSKQNPDQQLSNEKSKTSFIIKNLFPIISITIILIGLIILYRAGNIDQYMTDPMRIGFGYAISFSLLGGYVSDKIRKTFFSQVLLSAVLASLTITTIIGTNVYSVIPNGIGIVIMLFLFGLGLCIAYVHKSEIEFTTTAIIGAIIPILFQTNSFSLFLGFECGLFIALYIFLYFFKQTKVFQYILYWSMIITSTSLFFIGTNTYKMHTIDTELLILLFFIISSFSVPALLARWKMISTDFLQVSYFIQLVLTLFITFLAAVLIGKSELTTKLILTISILFLIAIIWLVRKYTQVITSGEKLHILIFSLLALLSLYLPQLYIYKYLCTLILIILHFHTLNFFFEKTTYSAWKKCLTIFFYIFTFLNAFPLFLGIFTFIFHIPFINHTHLHDKLITSSLFLVSLWSFYFFTNNKRAFAFDKSQLFITNWIVTAMYFLYIPWQLTNIILFGRGLEQLVIISVLWLSAAFTTTILAIKNGRIGLRIFTIIIIFFLTIKLLFIDTAFFLESDMLFQLSIYIITFGIATLILSRLLILEYTKNGSLLHEWQKFTATLRAEKNRKLELEMQKQQQIMQQQQQLMQQQQLAQQQIKAKAMQQQQTITRANQQVTSPNQAMPQPTPQYQTRQTPIPQPTPQYQTRQAPTPQPTPTPQPISPNAHPQSFTQSKPASALSETHIQYILNILNEQWLLQDKTLKAQKAVLDTQQQTLAQIQQTQQVLKAKIDYLTNELKK